VTPPRTKPVKQSGADRCPSHFATEAVGQAQTVMQKTRIAHALLATFFTVVASILTGATLRMNGFGVHPEWLPGLDEAGRLIFSLALGSGAAYVGILALECWTEALSPSSR